MKIPATLPHAETLRAELANFRVKVNLAGHDTYGAGAAPEWREGAHDDLVFAVAMAAWFGERDKGSSYSVQEPHGSLSFGPFGRSSGLWSPADDDDDLDDLPVTVASHGFWPGG